MAILRQGKTNERCLFGGMHLWTGLGEAMACGTCGRLDDETARMLGLPVNETKIILDEPGWLLTLRDLIERRA